MEVICSHFRIKKVTGMDLRQLQSLVALACGQMDKGVFLFDFDNAFNEYFADKFTHHIDVLCSVAPKYCTKDAFMGEEYLKVAKGARADRILKHVQEELARLSQRKAIKTEVYLKKRFIFVNICHNLVGYSGNKA